MPLAVSDIVERLQKADLLLETRGSARRTVVEHLRNDSRSVEPNDLFVAIRGIDADGHLHVTAALENGASVIVGEMLPEADSDALFVRVSSSRTAWAELSAEWFGDPSQALRMIGITGTNGKTTTAYLAHHVLTVMGEKVGLLGTIAYHIGEEEVEALHTTPDAYALHETLRQMVDEGFTSCVMEVSSHALEQARVHGIGVNVGVFTNLSRDHLDYHPSFDAYRTAKKRLFDGLTGDDIALYNLDDSAGRAMVTETRAQRVSYGQSPEADINFEVIDNRLDGLRLRIDGVERSFRLVGNFNAYNLAAAYGVGCAMDYAPSDVLNALAEAPPVPGRFEQFRFDNGTTVIVDFAHTPDALEHVLATLRSLLPNGAALWCVFGCGGDRDHSKRRIMGSIAEKLADRIMITSDNPRTEEPEAIMNDIRRGMSRPLEAGWIVDRAAAVHAVARDAAPGDVVLLAGKGHETYQLVGLEKRPFDDRELVRQYFRN